MSEWYIGSSEELTKTWVAVISAKYFNQEVKKFNNSTKKLFERISNGFFKVQVTQEKVMLFRDGELPPWLK